MNTTTYESPFLSVRLVAHADSKQRLLLVELTAAELPQISEQPPLQLALVLDRSGSMSGHKLATVREAASRLIRSLRPSDRVGVVIYDDKVEVLSPPAPPSEYLADAVCRIEAGGMTNLYGGWVRGAKMLKPGGHVVLLSDGLANVGRLTDAASLSHHASITYKEYKISTSTIGVGTDYDENLMASMARAGGGNHYFARDVEDVMKAFSSERWLVANRLICQMTLHIDKQTHLVGDLIVGEKHYLVIPIEHLPSDISIYFSVEGTNEEVRLKVPAPTEFGHSDEATAQYLISQARDLLDQVSQVSQGSEAEEISKQIRTLLIQMTNHPLADEPFMKGMRSLLETTKEQMDQLAYAYNHYAASLFRKRGAALSHSIQNLCYQGFFGDAEIQEFVDSFYLRKDSLSRYQVDPAAFAIAPPEQWIKWQMAPIQVQSNYVVVLTPRRRNGFVQAEVEAKINRYIKTLLTPITPEEVERLIRQAASA